MRGREGDGPPLVGRSAELRTVRAALDAGEAVALCGPAGIGKSTLARAVLSDRPSVAGGALSSLWTVPFLPLAQAVRRPMVGDAEVVAADLLRRLTGRTLLLEDLHWADQGTIDAVDLLVGRLPLLVTVRTTPAGASGAAGALIADGGGPVRVIDLAPLARRPARSLAARRHPTLPIDEIDRLVEVASGNPLLLEELPVSGAVTPTLQAALAARLGGLAPAVRHELLVLAIAAAPVDADGLPALLADADAGRILMRHGARLEFRHVALADAMVAESSDDELVDAHQRAAILVGDVVARCHHLVQAGREAEAERAADDALAESADEVEPIRRAALLSVLAATGRDRATALVAARAQLEIGNWDEAVSHADMVDPLDRERWPEGRLIAGLALWAAGRPTEAAVALDDGVAATSPLSPIGVRMRVEAANQAGRRSPGETSLERAEAALAAAQAAGVEQWRARAVLGQALMFCRRPGWADELRAVVAHARAAADDEAELSAAFALVSGLGFAGDLPEAVAVGRATLARLRHLPFGTWHAHFTGALVMHEMLLGRDRDGVVQRACELLAARPLFRNRAQVDCALIMAHADRGSFLEAEQALRDARRLARNDEDHALLFVADAELGWLRSDPARVAASLQAVRERAGDWFGVSSIVHALAAYAALDGVGAVPAEAPAPLLPSLGPLVVEHQALQRWAGGDGTGAVALLDDATRQWDAVHLTRFALRARWAAAELAVRQGRADARHRLHDLRLRASDLPAMEGRIGATDARLRSAASSLSAREHDVLALVGEGLTSTEIARRLGIATTTVESHIRSARRKLGARTRRQAVVKSNSSRAEGARSVSSASNGGPERVRG